MKVHMVFRFALKYLSIIFITLIGIATIIASSGGGSGSNDHQDSNYNLTISVLGNGTVVSTPEGINCGTDCEESFSQGTTVSLVATPEIGSQFIGWSGDADCSDGIVVLNADSSCTATFEIISLTYSLTILANNGSGTGSVTSVPAGINCGNDCVETYSAGTIVTLTATPDSGSIFVSWNGDVDCADGSVTMDTNVACQPVFDLAPFSLAFTPPSASRIGNLQTISLTFNELVNQSTIVVSGSLASESAEVSWKDDRTATISPADIWSAGRDRTLNISIEDVFGRTLENGAASYDVAIVYASIDNGSANDSNPGTKTLPFASLRPALDYAVNNFTEAEIHVALGTYVIDGTSNASNIYLAQKFSLYGGYALDWSNRDAINNITTITNPVGSFPVNIVDNNNAIVIDGFVISAGVDSTRALSIVNSNPIIRNNVLTAANSSLDTTYVISIDGSSTPDIDHNIITNSQSASSTRSIYVTGSSNALIRNNVVSAGGNGSLGSVALRITGTIGATATIYNNILYAGSNANDYAITSSSPLQHIIVNNTLHAYHALRTEGNPLILENNILENTGYTYCFEDVSAQGEPVLPISLEHNDFYGCTSIAKFFGGTRFDSFEEITALTGVSTVGSISLQPTYVNEGDNNYALTNTADRAITEGAKDRSDLFTTDINGSMRSVPWSMGANEIDDSTGPLTTYMDVNIDVDNACNMSVSPESINSIPGQIFYITWNNNSINFTVDIWASYAGGILDLGLLNSWVDPHGYCLGGSTPYQEYIDITNECASHRLYINCQ